MRKTWIQTILAAIVIFLVLSWYSYTSNFALYQSIEDSDTEVETVEDESVPDDITQRLRSAEAIWARGVTEKNKVINKVKLVSGIDFSHATTIWDLFYPSFDCPFVKERIGRVGDGGKWICGFDQLISKQKCIVLSFGINDETSFEEEILRRTETCVVYMFDPTMTDVPEIVAKYPNRAFFEYKGIGGQSSGTIETLKSIMTSLKLETIDILKMDVEGAEWETFQKIHEDFPETLPFAQLQVEVHLNSFSESKWVPELTSWFSKLEKAGLRQFFQETNLFGEPSSFRELCFVNTQTQPFKFG